MILGGRSWLLNNYYLISGYMQSMILGSLAWTRIPMLLWFLLVQLTILCVWVIWGISCLRHSKCGLLELQDILVSRWCPPVDDSVMKNCRRLVLWVPSLRPNCVAVTKSSHLVNVNRLIRYRVLVDKLMAIFLETLVFNLVALNSAAQRVSTIELWRVHSQAASNIYILLNSR